MPWWAIVAQIGGQAMQMMGASSAAKAQSSAMKSRAAALDRQADQGNKVGADNLRELVRRANEDVATSRVAAAKSGVKVGGGSAGDAERKIISDYRRTGERYSKDLAIEEENLRTAARTTRKMAGKVRKAGQVGALGQGVAAVGSVANSVNWDEYFDKGGGGATTKKSTFRGKTPP